MHAHILVCNRHCNCVYYQDWHRTRRPKPSAADGALLPAVSRAMTAPAPAQQAEVASPYNSPRNTLGSNSGVVIALNDGGAIPPWLQDHREAPHTLLQTPQTPVAAPASSALPFDEEAKLVYGVILSLRNMIKRLSGRYVLSCLFSRAVTNGAQTETSSSLRTRRVCTRCT